MWSAFFFTTFDEQSSLERYMFYELIKAWWVQPDCPCQPFLQYILERGKLRNAQIEAIRHYLYLKVAHDSKPLYQIFTEYTFDTITDDDISQSGCYFATQQTPTRWTSYTLRSRRYKNSYDCRRYEYR